MNDSNYLDADILAAVGAPRGQHENDPVFILAYVDARQKLLLTYEELEGGLRRLNAAAKISEIAHLKYAAGSDAAFSGITWAEYLDACNEYRRWFQETWSQLHRSRPAT